MFFGLSRCGGQRRSEGRGGDVRIAATRLRRNITYVGYHFEFEAAAFPGLCLRGLQVSDPTGGGGVRRVGVT